MMPTASERIRQARALREQALVEQGWRVETGVKGAYRIVTRFYPTQNEAMAAAARWRSSNSTGDYVAHVFDPHGERLAA